MPIRLLKLLLLLIYGAFSWLSLLLLGLLALVAMLLTPGLRRRRLVARFTARTYLSLIGIRLKVRGEDGLPTERCVVVANHTSYLDGLILTAVLPPRFGFVIKKEMDEVPLASRLLRLIGSEFVDRVNRHKGAIDARRVLRRASGGDSLVFFPEGTFSTQPGLLRFHTGAFATAVRAGCAVVPVIIQGARRALPSHRLVPTPCVIEVDMLPALNPAPGHRDVATHLREEARHQMLTRLGEPDLAGT